MSDQKEKETTKKTLLSSSVNIEHFDTLFQNSVSSEAIMIIMIIMIAYFFLLHSFLLSFLFAQRNNQNNGLPEKKS